MQRSIASGRFSALPAFCAPLMLLAAVSAHTQVFTVEPEHVEKHYTQFTPTSVKLSTEPMTTLTREQLIRFMQSEQGFAMRPLPIGNLTLLANGHMEPAGDKYVTELHARGVSARPGERVVVTDIKIHEDRVVLDLNGGPEHKHKYLRHVSIGMDPNYTNPVVQDSGAPPTGSRITLQFHSHIPDMSGEQMEALLKPMIDFGVKSPAEAYAETLPDFLRKAIEQHRVLIGMNRDMVVYAKGQPGQKIRESENGQPFEIWVYGEAPQPVEFVRFVGTYVARLEIAKVGEPVLVRSSNEMGDYWGNQPVVAANQHEVKMGDRTEADTNEENRPAAPPSLRKPGEKLPTDDDKKNPQPVMAPVNLPPDQRRPGDPGYTPDQTPSGSQQPASGTQQPASGSQQPPSGTSQQPASGSTSQPQQGDSAVAQPAPTAPIQP
jgi:hypothetical protein